MTTPTFGPPPTPNRAPSPPPPLQPQSAAAGIAVAALAVGGFALLVSIVVGALFAMHLVAPSSAAQLAAKDATVAPADVGSATAGLTIDTPCYSFEAPEGSMSIITVGEAELCHAYVESAGEPDDVLAVEAVTVAVAETWAADGGFDDVVAYLADKYSHLGASLSAGEPTTLDGGEAVVTSFHSDPELPALGVYVVGYSPGSYQTTSGEVRLFLITATGSSEAIEEGIEAVLETWRWK